MKITSPRSASTLAVLLPTLMLAAPVFAQEVPTQAAPAPSPVVQSAPAPMAQPAPAPVFAPASPIVQDVSTPKVAPPPVVSTVSDAPAADATTTPRRATTAQRTVRQAAPVRAAPIAATAPAPVAAAPAETAPPAAQPVAATPAPVAPTTEAAPATTTTQQATTQSTFAIWPWVVGAGIVLLGLIALLASRRRRRNEEAYTDEPVYAEQPFVEPTPVVAPIAAAPLVEREPQTLRPKTALATETVAAPAPVPAEETHIVDADQADVDALTDARAPVADRPWLEFGMRPVRAGTTSDEALVEIELTVGNAGSVSADDVRISTFLFASEPADAAEFERLLLDHGDAAADPVTIAAGEGTRVDATLALPKRDLAALFTPVVVADARYRLPDGSEGRTFASFSIGMTQEDGGLGAMENDRPSMHEDIEARLYGTPEHV